MSNEREPVLRFFGHANPTEVLATPATRTGSRLSALVEGWLANVHRSARREADWLRWQLQVRLEPVAVGVGVSGTFAGCRATLAVRPADGGFELVGTGSCLQASSGQKCQHQTALALSVLANATEARAAPGVRAMRREVGDESPEQQLSELVDGLALLERATRGRPVWVVDLEAGVFDLKLKAMTPLKSGAWSKPKHVSSRELPPLLSQSAQPQDRAIGRALAGMAALWEDSTHPLRTGEIAPSWLLSMLVGHPDVRLGDDGPPLEVRTGELGLHVTATEETVEVRACIGGERLGGGQLLGDEAGLVVLHPAERLLRAAPWSAEARLALEPLLDQPVVLPRALAPMLVDRLAALAELVPVLLPPELEGREMPADERLRVVFQPPGTAFLEVQLRVRPLGEGPAFVPGEGEAKVAAAVEGERRWARRELEAESARAQALATELGLANLAAGSAFVPTGDPMLELLAKLEALADPTVVVEWGAGATPVRVTSAAAKGVRVALEARQDWFDLNGEVELEGGSLGLGLLLGAQREGRKFVEVSRGRYAEVAKLVDRHLARLASLTHASQGRLTLSRAALADPEAAFDGVEVVVPLAWQELAARARRARTLVPQVPAALKAELRDYQVEGYRWLRFLAELGLGGCLADDMGLGKTVQALAMLVERAPQGPQLVLAPTSVGFNWLREAARFAPTLALHDLRRADRGSLLEKLGPGDVVVASYGLLRQEVERLAAVRFTTVVLDEAQAIKNWDTDTAKCARRLSAEWKIALTGTPVENHLGELYSLVQTVAPGVFGPWEQFSRDYATPIEKHGSPEKREALARLVRPVILRRTKGEVLRELPSRTEVRLDVVLSKAERGLYEAARHEAVAAIKGDSDEQERFQVLAALTRLRQLASHPRLVFPNARGSSSKVEMLVEHLAEVLEEGRAALVFSQFTSLLALVAERLKKEKIGFLQLTGQTPVAERVRLVDAFQRGESKLFLISLKAGGSGLNLTAADTVFLLDPWWNPAVEDQAADRAHRIGQTRPVTIVRLVAKDTVEEKVLALHDQKRALVAGVLEGSDVAGRLSASDLVDLLRGAGADATEDEADESGGQVSQQSQPAITPPTAPLPTCAPEAKGLWRIFREHASERFAPSTFAAYERICRQLLDGHLRGDQPFASLEERYRAIVHTSDRTPVTRKTQSHALIAFAQALALAGAVTGSEASVLCDIARSLRA